MKRLALLIDADNAQAANIENVVAEVAQLGVASVKRAYGDWTVPNLRGWKNVLHEHAIQPIQQFSYTTGKNSTDSALIIDAMDLLYTGKLDAFCIVSSDSDFTRLATRLREAGLTVYGIGEKKTPKSFVHACDKFIYTEILKNKSEPEKGTARKKMTTNELKQDSRLVTALRNAVDASSDEEGWAQLGSVGSGVSNQLPDFDPRNYGYAKLSDLIAAVKLFEARVTERKDGQKDIYVRDLKKKK
jgi:uncharacterized LabA/DUF88 family protein